MANSSTIDKREIEQFSAIAQEWWAAEGPFKPLHQMNPLRLRYIRDQLIAYYDLEATLTPLKGLSILDIGCGGGLLAEPLTRLGANVTGVDAAEDSIRVAKAHANDMKLDIRYIAGDAAKLKEAGEQFDAIINMEVLEHVSDMSAFLGLCHDLLKPGGLMLCSTLNRTRESFLKAIVGAEYIMRWLPRGTHDWQKFIKPEELRKTLETNEFKVTDVQGMTFPPLSGEWKLSTDTGVNYVMTAKAA